MSYFIKVDGQWCDCRLTDVEVCFNSAHDSIHIKIEDILGFDEVSPILVFRRYALQLWYIQDNGGKLTKEVVQISGDQDICEKLRADIKDKTQNLTKRPKSLLVLINPIGGNKTGVKDYKKILAPVFKLAGIKCDVIVSVRHKHMVDVVSKYDFKETHGVVILGGDGSFTEVVNVLIRKEQEKASIDIDDPAAKIRPINIPIGMIPTGSGNGIVQGTTGFKNVLNSALHVIKGNVSHLNVIGTYADKKLKNYAGIISSYGSVSDLVYHSDKYRRFGRLRYYVVTIWFGLLKPFIRPFEAELTFYTDVTETENSKKQIEGEKEVLIEGKKLTGVKSYSKDHVVLHGRYTNVMPLNGNVYDSAKKAYAWNQANKMPDHVFSTFLYHEDMTERHFFTLMKEGFQRKEERTTTHFDTVNARGVKVRVKDDKKRDGSQADILKHLIQIDGEIHEIEDLEIHFWIHHKIVPVFTSYLKDTRGQ